MGVKLGAWKSKFFQALHLFFENVNFFINECLILAFWGASAKEAIKIHIKFTYTFIGYFNKSAYC
jgi:hypothetical protein